MRLVWFLGCLAFCSGVFPIGVSRHVSSRPPFVNIGAIFTFNSTIGRVAKIAIEAAVDDINSNSSVLGGSKLVINMQDSNCSGFLGMFEALQFMETDIVAMVGPQSSVIAHVISHVANELQVPLLSFAATDPTLSSLQYPFFVRMTQSDLFQMSAIAELLDFYRWKNVIAVYIDNDYGRNGVSALGDKLAERRCKISYKAALPPGVTSDEIMNILVKVLMMESRIIVLHANLDSGLAVLSVAHYLGLMGNGYVWIATDWLSSVLDTSRPLAWETMESMQGILTLRQHTADSGRKRDFVSRWSKLTGKKKSDSLGLNAYGLYAYDTIWTIAHAINTFFNEGGTISFSNDPRLHDPEGASLNLEAMNIFDGGKLLLKNILQTDQMGITGPIRFDADGFLIHPAYDIINVVGTGIRNIGYWSNYSGLSIVTPETLYSKPPNRSSSNQQLKNVIWPGDMVAIPRGWVFPSNGNELRIGIPNRVSYRDFVSQVRGRDMVKGFCIDVFMAAVNLLPYAVRYRFIPYGDGQKNPSYTGLVNMITSNAFDAAVGDIAIVTNRTRIADFTQPYIESGLVIVAPVKKLNSNEWAFLRPFTLQMWCVTGAFFIVIGIVVWILEHRVNEDFRGPPRKEIITILWFSFSTLFFAHKNRAAFCGISFLCLFCPEIIGREITFSAYSAFSGPEALWILIHAERPPVPLQQLQDIQMQPNRSFCDLIDLGFFPYAEENIVSALARAILVLWLFVVLIIQSSYTASLTSILTVQQLSSSITGIDSLKASNEPIGFQVGSFIENYLIEELGIPKSRLVSLGTPEEYAAALQRGPKHGGVAAVVDELPYIELFLSTNCKFRIAGQLFTKGGWGFAFPRDSPLAVDMSTAILQLSENGDLQRIHDKWLIRSGCSLQSTEIESNTFHLKSFRGLFLICAVVCLLSLIIFFIRVIRQFIWHFRDEPNTLDQGRSGSGRLKKFLSFLNEKEKNGDKQIE